MRELDFIDHMVGLSFWLVGFVAAVSARSWFMIGVMSLLAALYIFAMLSHGWLTLQDYLRRRREKW